MRLELILPNRWGTRKRFGKSFFPPLGLATVAALTPEDVDITLTDENNKPVDFEKEVDIVGISTTTATANRAYEIADRYRAKGVKVIIGGVHPSFMPEEAIHHADAVVVGEAEGIWPSVIEDIKENRLNGIYHQSSRPNLIRMPIPRRDLLPKDGYFLSEAISATRGCPCACTFCTVTSFFGHTYRCRPIDEIIKEIETLDSRKTIAFLDDNIVGKPGFAKDLFRALIPLKLKWGAQTAVTIAKDDELLELAARSGCRILFIGFESISSANLAAVGKKINIVKEYEKVIQKIHSHGIAIHGFFIFGFDGDNEGIIKETVQFAKQMRLESAQFDYLTPYPGTELYNSMDDNGQIFTKNWSRYGYELVFQPKLLTREKLKSLHDSAWQEFYSLPSIWKRLGVFRPSVAQLWAINLFYRARWR